MALELSGKLITGALALATTSIGGVFLNNHLSPKTIGEELQRNEKLSLLKDDDTKWGELVNKYKSFETKDGNPAKIENFSLSSGSEDTSSQNQKELQDECKKLWNTDISKETESNITRKKSEIKTWCATDPLALKSSS